MSVLPVLNNRSMRESCVTESVFAACEDLKYGGAQVAVKIVRDEPLFRQAAVNEIKILSALRGRCGILRICRGQLRENRQGKAVVVCQGCKDASVGGGHKSGACILAMTCLTVTGRLHASKPYVPLLRLVRRIFIGQIAAGWSPSCRAGTFLFCCSVMTWILFLYLGTNICAPQQRRDAVVGPQLLTPL
jgi:hypothetical protein